MAAAPDSVTLLPGTAKHLWAPYAGKAALVVGGGLRHATRWHEPPGQP